MTMLISEDKHPSSPDQNREIGRFEQERLFPPWQTQRRELKAS